jgi:Cu(I)/Ag(I) efflux system membrane fusion protein
MSRIFGGKAILIALAGAGLVYAGYYAGMHHAIPEAEISSGTPDERDAGRKVLYWHDPMVPGNKFDKPGKSPFMDMQLVPVYADEGGTDGGVKVSPTLQQNLGIRFATVRREASTDAFEMVGTTQFDESVAEVVQSRVTGYIDRLYARSPMQRIKRGEPIASLFVPEWIAAQEEYLALRRSGNTELAAAAVQRMKAMSIPDGLVEQAVRTGKAQNHLTLTSPVTGVITELPVRDGAMVSPGATIAKVAGLNKVWLVAEIPEALTNSVRPEMTVEATFAGDPDRKHTGKVREILPGVSATTRTVQARLELDNRDGSLTPGMLMRVRLVAAAPVSRLLVPTEAVITTGRRSVVLVVGENDSMQPVTVTTGRDVGDDTEILTGLTEGQKVVASGQFLVDSEASLKSVLPKLRSEATQGTDKMAPAAMAPAAIGTAAGKAAPTATTATAATASPTYHGIGIVEKATDQALTLSHHPIPELKWGAMTMGFNKPSKDAFAQVKPGDNVAFSFKEGKDGYVLEDVTPAPGAKK